MWFDHTLLPQMFRLHPGNNYFLYLYPLLPSCPFPPAFLGVRFADKQ
jgi:hypothetical protein